MDIMNIKTSRAFSFLTVMASATLLLLNLIFKVEFKKSRFIAFAKTFGCRSYEGTNEHTETVKGEKKHTMITSRS